MMSSNIFYLVAGTPAYPTPVHRSVELREVPIETAGPRFFVFNCIPQTPRAINTTTPLLAISLIMACLGRRGVSVFGAPVETHVRTHATQQ